MSSNRDVFLFFSENDQVEVLTETGTRMTIDTFKDRFIECEALGEVD